jgi:hypothetical protein
VDFVNNAYLFQWQVSVSMVNQGEHKQGEASITADEEPSRYIFLFIVSNAKISTYTK